MRHLMRFSFFLSVALWLAASTAIAYPRAVQGQRVYDEAGFMPNAARREQLQEELLAFERSHGGTQIAVVTVNDTEGETIESYGTGIFRAWGIGQRGQNNGVLLLISRQADSNRNKTRIEVGYGLEGQLPDVICNRIINDVIMPIAHDQHDTQGAIETGARAIMRRLDGDTRPIARSVSPAAAHSDQSELTDLFIIVIVIALAIYILVLVLRPRSRRWGSSSGWSSGSSDFGGSSCGGGGGGSDFGGGDSGGGGSSGGFD